jgi:dienelactone hydrolase
MEWTSLDPFMFDPFSKSPSYLGRKWFKDDAYQDAVLNAWSQEKNARDETIQVETSPIVYRDRQGTSLYGHFVRRKDQVSKETVPGLLLFHTGAGPQDMFLLWKAESLVTNSDVFPDGCVVLICDLLSDEPGWAWNPDRTRYNEARDELFAGRLPDGTRPVLLDRVTAACETLLNVPEIDSERIAALGWCLGGHPILELGRLIKEDSSVQIKGLITFHGVFDGVEPSSSTTVSTTTTTTTTTTQEDSSGAAQVLICNGSRDPFVKSSDLDAAVATFQAHGHKVQVLPLDAKHGFTNPAQDFSDNPSFRFDELAAATAWTETLKLLKSACGRE